MQELNANQRFAYLFKRYFQKECTLPEEREFFSMLRTGKYDHSLRTLIDATWDNDLPPYRQDDDSAKQILAYILNQTAEKEPDGRRRVLRPEEEMPRLGKRRIYLKCAIAASLIGLILTSFFRYYYHAAHLPMARSTQSGPSISKDRYLTLSDGSKVLLHKGAQIDYPPTFDGKTREVTLKGEAFFDIRAGAAPFIVHTGNIKTTVLGTAFDIAYDKNITVTVARGKVKVENDKGEFSILKGNEQVTVDAANSHLKKEKVDASEAIAWKKPYLLFNDVSMKEAAQELQRHFHVTISFSHPDLENCSVTASFVGNESLEEVIKILSKINNMDYAFSSPGKIVLSGEGCN